MCSRITLAQEQLLNAEQKSIKVISISNESTWEITEVKE